MKQLAFAVILTIAIGFFARTIRRYVRVLRMGVRDARPRGDQLAKRLWTVLVYFFAQKKVAERQIRPAVASYHHLLIFWGFLLITIGTAETLIAGVIPAFRFELFLGDAIAGVLSIVIDIMNAVVLVMVAYAAFRRLVLRPRLIPMSLDAALVLSAIGGLMVTHFATHAFEAVAAGSTAVPSAPVSSVFAALFGGVSVDAAHVAGEISYWLHVVLVLAFLNYLPYSKHIHLLGALPNIFAANLSSRRFDIPKADLEDESQWGVGLFQQFSWKSLLDTYACTECARCSNYCPANATGKPLSPMHLIHDVRHEMLERGGMMLDLERAKTRLAEISPAGDHHSGPEVAHDAPAFVDPEQVSLERRIAALSNRLDEMPPMVGGRILDETLWACTMCGACQESCPVFIEHPLKILQMRQHLVLEKERVPADLARTFRNIERNSNPWGIGNDRRMEWAEGLAVPTFDDKPNAEYLLWVGCAGAFDQRIRKQTQAMVRLFDEAAVDYAILGAKESCCGDPARRGGNEMLFQMQAQANIEVLNAKGVKKIITACPHCVHTLRHDYPQFGGTYEVVHHTQLLSRLVEKGKLRPTSEVARRIVYHDSCYLGRWNGEFDAPRQVLEALPTSGGLVEVERQGRKGFCCGAGGGRMFMEETTGSRVNRVRTEELVSSGADAIAVACPYCNVMMTDGIKDLGKEDDVRVLDVAELLCASLPKLHAIRTPTTPPSSASH